MTTKQKTKIRVHFKWPDGTDDSVELSGSDDNELGQRARQFVKDRNGKEPWSEVIE